MASWSFSSLPSPSFRACQLLFRLLMLLINLVNVRTWHAELQHTKGVWRDCSQNVPVNTIFSQWKKRWSRVSHCQGINLLGYMTFRIIRWTNNSFNGQNTQCTNLKFAMHCRKLANDLALEMCRVQAPFYGGPEKHPIWHLSEVLFSYRRPFASKNCFPWPKPQSDGCCLCEGVIIR